MSDESKDHRDGFKVVDRRRFTSDGVVRDESDQEARSTFVDVSKSQPGSSTSGGSSASRDTVRGAERGAQMTKNTEQTSAPTQSASADHDKLRSGHEYSPVNFSSFIVGLAHQAMVMLGEVPDPRTGKANVSLEGARETIDLLALLEEKTQGNLNAEETRLLTEVLATLRLAFVGKARGRGEA